MAAFPEKVHRPVQPDLELGPFFSTIRLHFSSFVSWILSTKSGQHMNVSAVSGSSPSSSSSDIQQPLDYYALFRGVSLEIIHRIELLQQELSQFLNYIDPSNLENVQDGMYLAFQDQIGFSFFTTEQARQARTIFESLCQGNLIYDDSFYSENERDLIGRAAAQISTKRRDHIREYRSQYHLVQTSLEHCINEIEKVCGQLTKTQGQLFLPQRDRSIISLWKTLLCGDEQSLKIFVRAKSIADGNFCSIQNSITAPLSTVRDEVIRKINNDQRFALCRNLRTSDQIFKDFLDLQASVMECMKQLHSNLLVWHCAPFRNNRRVSEIRSSLRSQLPPNVRQHPSRTHLPPGFETSVLTMVISYPVRDQSFVFFAFVVGKDRLSHAFWSADMSDWWPIDIFRQKKSKSCIWVCPQLLEAFDVLLSDPDYSRFNFDSSYNTILFEKITPLNLSNALLCRRSDSKVHRFDLYYLAGGN